MDIFLDIDNAFINMKATEIMHFRKSFSQRCIPGSDCTIEFSV